MERTEAAGGPPAEANRHGGEPVNPDVRFERKDVRTSGVLWFAFWLAVAAIVIQVGLWGLFKLFEAESAKRQPAVAPNVALSLRRTPAEPRLEPLPLAARARLRAEEDARLTTYGWVNRAGGVARIPIERAMELVVERGVPGGKPLPPPPPEAFLPAGTAAR